MPRDMTQPTDSLVYKITTQSLFEQGQRQGTLPPSPVDEADGFMHFSTLSQLKETLKLHFKGQSGLVVAEIPVAPLGDALRWEPSRGGALFPHLYADLDMSQISRHWPASVDDNGVADLPSDLS